MTRRRWLMLALLAIVGSLASLKYSRDRQVAWDAAVGRAMALVAQYAPAETSHAPLLGEPIRGEAVACFEDASSRERQHGDDEEPPWSVVMAMDTLPTDIATRLQPLLPAFDRLAAGAAADRIDQRLFFAPLLRAAHDRARIPPVELPIGTALLTSPALTAARADFAAGRTEAAVQRTATVLTLARDQFGIGVGVYDLSAAIHIFGVDRVWNDDRLRRLPATEQKMFALALERFEQAVAPATRSMFGDFAWALRLGGLSQRRFCTAAKLGSHADALAALPPESAPWPVRESALAKVAASWPALARDLVEIERNRRQAIAQVRLLRMALALHLGEACPPLGDPLAEGQLSVSERDGQTLLASRTAVDGKSIERLVKRH